MTTLVRIDPTLCRGHAICALYFADGVELDQWGFGRVLDASPTGRRAVRRARRAAAACPNGAVVVTESPDPVPVAVVTPGTPDAGAPGAGHVVPASVPVAPPRTASVAVRVPEWASGPAGGDHPGDVPRW